VYKTKLNLNFLNKVVKKYFTQFTTQFIPPTDHPLLFPLLKRGGGYFKILPLLFLRKGIQGEVKVLFLKIYIYSANRPARAEI
jgi:hypothetical protein